jgi:hypothetical protein
MNNSNAFFNIIQSFINTFGMGSYIIFVLGSILLFCIYAGEKSIASKDFDRVYLIALFALVVLSSLLGVGLDAYRSS